MGAFDDLIPKGRPANADTSAFADLIPKNPLASNVTGGGVQDYEPITSRHVGTIEIPQHPVLDRIGTRIENVIAGAAGLPRAAADIQRYGAKVLGLPEAAGNALVWANPITAVSQFLPTAKEITDITNKTVGFRPVSGHTPGGKILDAATEAALGGIALPGAGRNLIPSLVGGATQEVAGQATKGTEYEPAARLLGATVGGGGTAMFQNALESVVQGIKNLRPNIDDTAAKVIARGVIRDKTTMPALGNALADLGPGAPVVEAGGPNVRAVMRGAIAAPGESRTTAQNVFDTRMQQMPDMATNALDTAISPNRSLAASVEDIATAQSKAAGSAYRAAGIPDRIIATEGPPSPPPVGEAPVRMSSLVGPDGQPIPLRLRENMPQGGAPPTKTFNTPTIQSPAIDALLKDSKDIQQAIATARQLPDFKDLPSNSMAMLDKAYKHLGDMERKAAQDVSGTRANDIKNLRQDFKAAITEANPAYGAALDAYSGPQRIIDAAQRGKDWFTKNVDPAIVKREFDAMSPGEQQAAKDLGARDWAREIVSSRSGRGPGDIAQRTTLQQGQDRARLQAILDPTEFAALEKQMKVVKNAIGTNRDINVGSRTAPMGLEAADNASGMDLNALTDLARGRVRRSIGTAARSVLDRVIEGRTEAVNARIADMLSSTDPQQVGLVNALAEKARLAELARNAGRRNALVYSGLVNPARNALAGANQ